MHVYGIRPPDDKWLKMKAVYEACRDARVAIPDQVVSFFAGGYPDDKDMIVSLSYPDHESVTEFSNDYQEGCDIDVTKLPPDFTIVRVVNLRCSCHGS